MRLFKEAVKKTCNVQQGAHTHPMCECIAGASETQVSVKNCLMQHPHPSVYTDWNIGAVTAALFLWFLASLATSVGTLPMINTYIHWDPSNNTNSSIVVWNRPVVGAYILLTVIALILPIIFAAIQFGGSVAHINSVLNMLMWSVLSILGVGVFNFQTMVGYITYMVHPEQEKELVEMFTDQYRMSLHNCITYVHLLVAAPAIAMVLHLTQQWTEYHTIVNTTLIFSTIFAVDGFAAEMANNWAHHAAETNHIIFGKTPTDAQVTELQKQAVEKHTRLGLLRLFAWIVNAVMLLLLITLAYPMEVGGQHTSSAIFIVIAVVFAAIFLAPDLVREFTDYVSFNSIQFRLYGDFLLRALTLWFVWRASTADRV